MAGKTRIPGQHRMLQGTGSCGWGWGHRTLCPVLSLRSSSWTLTGEPHQLRTCPRGQASTSRGLCVPTPSSSCRSLTTWHPVLAEQGLGRGSPRGRGPWGSLTSHSGYGPGGEAEKPSGSQDCPVPWAALTFPHPATSGSRGQTCPGGGCQAGNASEP